MMGFSYQLYTEIQNRVANQNIKSELYPCKVSIKASEPPRCHVVCCVPFELDTIQQTSPNNHQTDQRFAWRTPSHPESFQCARDQRMYIFTRGVFGWVVAIYQTYATHTHNTVSVSLWRCCCRCCCFVSMYLILYSKLYAQIPAIGRDIHSSLLLLLLAL